MINIERNKLYTTKELSALTGVCTRTLSNRLLFLRVSYPEACVIERLRNNRPLFKYKGEYLTEEMLLDRDYKPRKDYSKEVKLEGLEVNLPPVYKYDKNGNKYNLFALKAFLRMILNKKLYLTAKYTLHMLFWVFIITYIWRM